MGEGQAPRGTPKVFWGKASEKSQADHQQVFLKRSACASALLTLPFY